MDWHYQPDEEVLHDADFLAVAHYLLYWKVDPVIRPQVGQHRTTAYAASSQLRKTKPGDVVWIITVHEGHLYLLGRLQVEFVVDDTFIAQELVDPQRDEWYEADWYAISNKYTIEPMRELDITPLAAQLQFVSHTSRHLDVVNGKVDVHQVRALRQLETISAQLLDDIWYSEKYTPETIQDFLELTEDDQAYAEGKVVVRTMKQRQRSRQLVKEAKAKFRAEHDGHLFCEACGFDFDKAYGITYIEAHHTEPIASLEDEIHNTTDAVVLLCANCHRAAHTRTPPYSIDELKNMLNTNEKDNNRDDHDNRHDDDSTSD